MATDSTATGFLAPTSSSPYDDDLDDILHAVIVGMTGISGDLVRPRWQPEPPNEPDFQTNWIAFGYQNMDVDTFAFERQGTNEAAIERDELIDYLHSFYGPGASGVAERFRDGFEVAQNRDTLAANNIGLVEVQKAQKVPALLKSKWVTKVDVVVTYRRRTSRSYPILTTTSAQGQLVTDHGQVDVIIVTTP